MVKSTDATLCQLWQEAFGIQLEYQNILSIKLDENIFLKKLDLKLNYSRSNNIKVLTDTLLKVFCNIKVTRVHSPAIGLKYKIFIEAVVLKCDKCNIET